MFNKNFLIMETTFYFIGCFKINYLWYIYTGIIKISVFFCNGDFQGSRSNRHYAMLFWCMKTTLHFAVFNFDLVFIHFCSRKVLCRICRNLEFLIILGKTVLKHNRVLGPYFILKINYCRKL